MPAPSSRLARVLIGVAGVAQGCDQIDQATDESGADAGCTGATVDVAARGPVCAALCRAGTW